MRFEIENLVREFLTQKKIVGLVRLVKPIDIITVLVKHLDLLPQDAAIATLGLVKGANNFQDRDLEKYVGEGLPLSQPKAGGFPVPNKLKKANPPIDEMSPLRGEPEFNKNVFPPEKHRKMPQQFPYDDQTVRWSRVRGTTPRSGHQR